MLAFFLELLVSWLLLPRLFQWAVPAVMVPLGLPLTQGGMILFGVELAAVVVIFFWRRILALGLLLYIVVSKVDWWQVLQNLL